MPTWAKWGLALAGLLVVLYGVREYAQAREEAQAADRRAEATSDSLAAARAAAELARELAQRVADRERQVRDSLDAVLDSLEAGRGQRQREVEVTTADVDTTLAVLAEKVRPELRPLVRTGQEQLSDEREARQEQLEAARQRGDLWKDKAGSFQAELISLQAAHDSTMVELQIERSLTARLRKARDKWRQAAGTKIFGLFNVDPGLTCGLTNEGKIGCAAGASLTF